jgi:hypothetical protein
MLKVTILGVLGLSLHLAEASSPRRPSHVVYEDLQFDCFGCFKQRGWYCAKQDSPNNGRCSDIPYSDCEGFTWQGSSEDNIMGCSELVKDYHTTIKWPSTGDSQSEGKDISYDYTKVTVRNPYAGQFIFLVI